VANSRCWDHRDLTGCTAPRQVLPRVDPEQVYPGVQRLLYLQRILFNRDSLLRGEGFITRRVTRAAGRINEGLQGKLYIGNLDARCDWGLAGDYVRGDVASASPVIMMSLPVTRTAWAHSMDGGTAM
jgi:hypothetical protein